MDLGWIFWSARPRETHFSAASRNRSDVFFCYALSAVKDFIMWG